MSYEYSRPSRIDDPFALPDVEVFRVATADAGHDCPLCCPDSLDDDNPHTDHVGWFWQACFPGCLPDSEPYGPFESREAALADAREGFDDDVSDVDDDSDADPSASPDIEVFGVTASTPAAECPLCNHGNPNHDPDDCDDDEDAHTSEHVGFYWWSCLPG